MDMGAEALMVPMIQSAGEAEAMVAAALYPPAGVRGYAAPGCAPRPWHGRRLRRARQ